jgi:FMN phosphatase YigB (HAD superfamily)
MYQVRNHGVKNISSILKRNFSKFDPSQVRVVSFDITGTILTHREPVAKSYADAAKWARLYNPPNELEMRTAFKKAFKEVSLEYPCFGGEAGLSDREWWVHILRRTLQYTGRDYSDFDFNRFFRRVYQHYGSTNAYSKLDDAIHFIEWLKDVQPDVVMGVISNTPYRSVESALPMTELHDHFKWHVCPKVSEVYNIYLY